MDKQRWWTMTVSEQILNIGGEVQRACDWRAKGDEEKAQRFFDKAMGWFELTINDPKNKNRIRELSLVEEELSVYFASGNNKPEEIMDYYDSFMNAIY